MAPIVEKRFPGATVAILAGGNSLTREDADYIRGKAVVIAINDAGLPDSVPGRGIAPWADVLYAADKEWWLEYDGVPSFTGPKYALPSMAYQGRPWPQEVTVLRNAGDLGLELDPSGLKTGGVSGGNSGYQAINLAVHLGATRILLLGYDMQRTNGKLHWHGNHPDNLHRNCPFAEFLKGYPSLVKPLKSLGVEIVNCSRQTALTCFPQMPIEQALRAAVTA